MTAQQDLSLDAQPDDHKLRGNLATAEDVRTYVLGGRGMVTVESDRTGVHRTYRLHRTYSLQRDTPACLVVHVLTGPERSAAGSWTYVGALTPADGQPPSLLVQWRFNTFHKPTGLHAQARWAFARIGAGGAHAETVLAQATVYHEGVCGRCGRALTHPDSIRSGLGPVCAAKGAL